MNNLFKNSLKLILKNDLGAFVGFLVTLITLVISYYLDKEKPLIKLIPIYIAIIYLYFYLRKTIVTANAISGYVNVPYSVCFAQSREWHVSALKQQELYVEKMKVPWVYIKGLFKINQVDWSYYSNAKILPTSQSWIDSLLEVKAHFERYSNRIEQNTNFHLFFVTPEAFTFALGAIVGVNNRTTVHQFHPDLAAKYLKVDEANIESDLKLGSDLLDLEQSVADDEPNKTGTNICIQSDKYPLPMDKVPDLNSKSTLVIKFNLELDEQNISLQWSSVADAISSEIKKALNNGQQVNMFMGIPAALSYMIGKRIGSNAHICVFHYERPKKQFYQVFDFSKL